MRNATFYTLKEENKMKQTHKEAKHYLQEMETILHTLEKEKLGSDYHKLMDEASKKHYGNAVEALSSYEQTISSLLQKLENPPNNISRDLKKNFRQLRQKLSPFVSQLKAMKKVYADEAGMETEEPESPPEVQRPPASLPPMPEPESPEARLDPLEEPELPPEVQRRIQKNKEPSNIIMPDEPSRRKKTKQRPADIAKDLYSDQIKKINNSISIEKNKIKQLQDQFDDVSSSDKEEINKEITGRERTINRLQQKKKEFLEKRKDIEDQLTEKINELLETSFSYPPEVSPEREKWIEEPELPPEVQRKLQKQKKKEKTKSVRPKKPEPTHLAKTRIKKRVNEPEKTNVIRPTQEEQVKKLTQMFTETITNYLSNKNKKERK